MLRSGITEIVYGSLHGISSEVSKRTSVSLSILNDNLNNRGSLKDNVGDSANGQCKRSSAVIFIDKAYITLSDKSRYRRLPSYTVKLAVHRNEIFSTRQRYRLRRIDATNLRLAIKL